MKVAKELQSCVASPSVWFYLDQLESKLKQAVEDIRLLGRMGQNVCPVCANYNHGQGCKECIKCLKEDNFKWRGLVEKEETT